MPKIAKMKRQKCGISRQPNVSRRNFVRTAQAVDAVLQPVLGDVAVDEGIGEWRETKQEEQPQPERGAWRTRKKPKVLAHKLAHAKNIPCFAVGIAGVHSQKQEWTDFIGI